MGHHTKLHHITKNVACARLHYITDFSSNKKGSPDHNFMIKRLGQYGTHAWPHCEYLQEVSCKAKVAAAAAAAAVGVVVVVVVVGVGVVLVAAVVVAAVVVAAVVAVIVIIVVVAVVAAVVVAAVAVAAAVAAAVADSSSSSNDSRGIAIQDKAELARMTPYPHRSRPGKV